MSIIRISHDKNNPYVMLNKNPLEDNSLSWAAKGLWAYLMSRPDNWNVSVSHLSTIYHGKGGGEKAIYSLLNELIEAGYCERNQGHTEGKRLEPIALASFCEQLGHELKPCVVQSDERPWQIASLDGISECRTMMVEIKCSQNLYEKAKNKIVPDYYMDQMQHQLFLQHQSSA